MSESTTKLRQPEGCAPMAGSVSSEAPICSNCGHRAQLSHLDDDGAPHWGCAECGRRLNRMAIKTMGGNVWRRLVRNARKYRKEAACQGPQNDDVMARTRQGEEDAP